MEFIRTILGKLCHYENCPISGRTYFGARDMACIQCARDMSMYVCRATLDGARECPKLIEQYARAIYERAKKDGKGYHSVQAIKREIRKVIAHHTSSVSALEKPTG